MRRDPIAPLVAAASVFVLAGGWIHLREWLDGYRDVPSTVPGAEVVTVGFPVNAAASVLAAGALVVALFLRRRWLPAVVGVTALFQVGSLAVLVLSRRGSFLGWEEPVWTMAAEQTRAVEIGALLCLALLGGFEVLRSRDGAQRVVAARTAATSS